MPQDGEVVRCLPYPVLEDGNLSYPEGDYTVDAKPQDDDASVIIHHTIRGAPFLDRIIQQGKGKYGCLVSVPLTGYRRLHLSDDAYQRVAWDIGVVGEPPMLRPLIISVSEISCELEPEDGVAGAWQGREIKFPRGARLALKRYLRPSSSLHELLDVRKDPNLEPGSFEVKPCDAEGFYFQVSVASDLYPFLQNAGEHRNHRESILTHVTSRCFEILKDYPREHGDDEEESVWWETYRNLSALSEELRRNNLPVWDEEGFSADKVATRLYPHRPPQSGSEE